MCGSNLQRFLVALSREPAKAKLELRCRRSLGGMGCFQTSSLRVLIAGRSTTPASSCWCVAPYRSLVASSSFPANAPIAHVLKRLPVIVLGVHECPPEFGSMTGKTVWGDEFL